MMRFLLYLAIALPLMAQDFHIDHVTVAGKNLKAMTEALRTVAGITAEYGGPHSNHRLRLDLARVPGIVERRYRHR